MKKKITILSIFMIAIILFTSSVFAAETFTYKEKNYVIDEVKLKLDSLSDNLEFLGMDKDNNYVIGDVETEIIYKVNEKKCTEMTMQEILDFLNSKYDIMYDIRDDLNIYEEKMSYYAGIQELIVTEDTVIDSNKEYYKIIADTYGGYSSELVENPDLSNGIFYEYAYLVFPRSAIIDENITYYKQEQTTYAYTRVENPKEEEILQYKVIGNPDEYYSIKKIGELTKQAYDKIMPTEDQNIMLFGFDIIEDKENNDMFIIAEYGYSDSQKCIIYKLDGTVIKEYDKRMTIMPIGNEFFAIAPIKDNGETDSSKMTIIDKEGKTILENTNIPYLQTLKYDKYTTYLKHYEFDVNKFYNMYEYQLLSQDSQKYEGKDLTIKTSGELDRLTSVKVNGVELEASNYTKTSGSTIITLKNDYLKTLALGTYTLELGYVDGTKVETKFIVDTLYNNDEGKDENSEGITDNIGGETGAGTSGGAGVAIPKPEDKLDETPKTGNAKNNSNLGLYITLIMVAVGAIIIRKK